MSLFRSVSGDCSQTFNEVISDKMHLNARTASHSTGCFLIWFSLTTFIDWFQMLWSFFPCHCFHTDPFKAIVLPQGFTLTLARPFHGLFLHPGAFLRFHSQRFTLIKQFFQGQELKSFYTCIETRFEMVWRLKASHTRPFFGLSWTVWGFEEVVSQCRSKHERVANMSKTCQIQWCADLIPKVF